MCSHVLKISRISRVFRFSASPRGGIESGEKELSSVLIQQLLDGGSAHSFTFHPFLVVALVVMVLVAADPIEPDEVGALVFSTV